MICKSFPPADGSSFHSSNNKVCKAKVFSIDDVHFINIFSFLYHAFNVISENFSLTQGHDEFPLHFLLRVL